MRNMPRFLLLLFSISLVFFALRFPAAGAANVSRTAGSDSLSPRIAVDSAGNIHVVWGEYYSDTSGDAYYSKYDISSKTWSVPLNLSNNGLVYTNEFRPVGIDIDSSNNIYVIYVEGTRVSMRIFSGGNWGSPIQLCDWNTGDADCPRVAVDSSGNIFTAWWVTDYFSIQSRARVGGAWENVQTISGGGAKLPDIAVGNSTVYACWTQRTDTYRIYYTRRNKAAGAAWSTPELVSPSTTMRQQVPAIEIDGNEVAHVVFTPVQEDGNRFVQYCYWTGSGFSLPQDLSDGAYMLHYPALHERGNNLYCAWQVGGYGNGSDVRYSNKIGGGWTGEGSVPDSSGCTYCDLATSPSQGNVYYVWDANGEIWCNMGETGTPPPPPPPPSGNPVASFVLSPSSGTAPLAVIFDAAASSDSDGSIVTYGWNFGDGSTGVGRVVTHTYATAGTFTVRLTVTDNDGKTGSTTRTVQVIKANDPPMADFTFSPQTGLYPIWIEFNASPSRDPDGQVVEWSWDFGDGFTGSGLVIGHHYTRPGSFGVRLIVRDDRGAAASSFKTVVILKLFQPLNIRYVTYVDASLFRSRYITELKWERNPANDSLGVQIVLYRIWRKKTGEPDTSFIPIAEVTEGVYSYWDKDVPGKDYYAYTVTAIDGQGHESPFAASGFASPSGPQTMGSGTQVLPSKGKLRGL